MRDELGIAHPIIDMDGHVVELFQATVPYLREALGPALFTRYIEREHAAALRRPHTGATLRAGSHPGSATRMVDAAHEGHRRAGHPDVSENAL